MLRIEAEIVKFSVQKPSRKIQLININEQIKHLFSVVRVNEKKEVCASFGS